MPTIELVDMTSKLVQVNDFNDIMSYTRQFEILVDKIKSYVLNMFLFYLILKYFIYWEWEKNDYENCIRNIKNIF